MAVTRNSKCLALLSATIVALLTMSGPAFTGDDDKAPAYMIYIDPETGKYTTTRPHSVGTATAAEQLTDAQAAPNAPPVVDAQPMVSVQSTSDVQTSNHALIIAGAGVLVALLLAGIIKNQRKDLHSG